MRKRMLLDASYGGYWGKMQKLASVSEKLDQHYVSTNTGLAQSVFPARFTAVPDANLVDKRAGLVRMAKAGRARVLRAITVDRLADDFRRLYASQAGED